MVHLRCHEWQDFIPFLMAEEYSTALPLALADPLLLCVCLCQWEFFSLRYFLSHIIYLFIFLLLIEVPLPSLVILIWWWWTPPASYLGSFFAIILSHNHWAFYNLKTGPEINPHSPQSRNRMFWSIIYFDSYNFNLKSTNSLCPNHKKNCYKSERKKQSHMKMGKRYQVSSERSSQVKILQETKPP